MGGVSTFELRALSPARGEQWTDEAVVLIDGLDQLSLLGAGPSRNRLRWMGLEPESAIGPTSSLLARPKPHDTFVARCSCSHLGCDALTARIRRRDQYVVWDQFRRGPGAKKVELDVAPFMFDADEYRHSVLGVGSPASTWQPTTRQAALQLNLQLVDYRDELNRLTFARVHYLDDERVVVSMRLGERKDDDRAYLSRVLNLKPQESAEQLATRVVSYVEAAEILNDPLATRRL